MTPTTLSHIQANFPVGVCLMVDGKSRKVHMEDVPNPQTGCHFDIHKVKAILGIDMIEIVRTKREGVILIVDEEGLLKPDPILNLTASLLAGQRIYGNVFICHTSRVN